MNNKYLNKEKGSTLLSVIFFATIIMVLLAAGIKLVINDYGLTHLTVGSSKAFHIAESGIERAVYALQYDQYPASVWGIDESGQRYLEFDLDDGGKVTHCKVELSAIDANNFEIVSTATTQVGRNETTRKIRVLAEVEETKQGASNYYQPDFIFREHVYFREYNQNPFMAASWNSEDSRDPIFKPAANANTGYDVIIASVLDEPGAIELRNSWIDGSVGVAGNYMPQYNTEEEYSNLNQDKLRARLKGPNTPDAVLFDPDRVIHNFEYDFAIPVCPDPNDFNIHMEVKQNAYKDAVEVLGVLNKSTFIRVSNSFNPSNMKFIIQGDVFMYVDGPINVGGNIEFYMNGDDSRFTIMSSESMSFGDSVDIQSRYPRQFLVLQGEVGKNIVIHNKRFSGYIYAPNSGIQLHGSSNATDEYEHNIFLGGIVGKTFDHTNSFILVSDSSMERTGGVIESSDAAVVILSDWQELPSGN